MSLKVQKKPESEPKGAKSEPKGANRFHGFFEFVAVIAINNL